MRSSQSGRKRLTAAEAGARPRPAAESLLNSKRSGGGGPRGRAASKGPSAAAGTRPTSPPPPAAGTTTAMSSNTARYAAACAANLRQWILAVKQPAPPPVATTASGGADGATDAEEGGTRNVHSASSTVDDIRRRSSASASVHLPLEERIGLPELKCIMRAFQVPPHDAQAPGPKYTPPTRVAEGGRGGAHCAAPAPLALGTLRSVDELSAIITELPRHPHSAQTADRPCTADAVDSRSVSTAHTRRTGVATPAHTPTPHPSAAAQSPPLPTSAATVALPLRNLSQEEFIHAIQSAVPSATLPEIQALLTKAISETQDTVSWNELATFLVTRSRQKADLALENQRFVLGGQPCGLRFDEQHGSSITCVAVEPVRRLLVTGCSGGSVRAWSSGSDLAYRGLLLQVNKWIVGLHWGCQQRVLYVLTMDRWLYVLDGTTYEVLRVFHGRGITESPVSITYASETVGLVRVGGVALTKRNLSSARSYGGARLMPQSTGSAEKQSPSLSPRPPASQSSGRESREERMRRLLSSAMHVRRAVRPAGNDPTTAEQSHRGSMVQANGGTRASFSMNTSVVASLAAPPTTTLATVYSLTTAGAAEALHQDNTPLTGAGRGPYVPQQLEEGVLTGLVDPVTASTFHESAFQEDVLLLGTGGGDVFLFQPAQQHHLLPTRVLVARHVFRQLHRGRITKLDLLLSLDALVSSGDDGYVRVTSLVTGQPLRHFYAADLPEQHASVTDFDLHPQLKMLLTLGPERRALVWEWTQPSPIAVLDPANSPCCGGAFMGDRVLTISSDSVLHVYDCKGFRLQQELSLASTGSLDRFGSSVGASHAKIAKMHVEEARQRLLCFGHFPFSLCVKRQVSSGCPERYRGHHAPMLSILSSRAFGQVVTVGTDGVIMTWTPRTGVNEFSFLLSNFSNATTAAAPLRPTAAAIDVLQRRLLTGFADGTMVVWNILNGQVERVLTAAASAPAATGASAAAAIAAVTSTTATATADAAVSPSRSSSPAPPRHQTRGTPRSLSSRKSDVGGRARRHTTVPAAAGAADASAAGVERPGAVGAASASAPKRDVTAVGSFLRHRSMSYIFALGSRLYVDAAVESTGAAAQSSGPQLGEYSTTPASSWTVPAAFGDVTKLVQLGPQLVGCGTVSGAVLLYNVLFDRQEGAPLWARESLLSAATSADLVGVGGTRDTLAQRHGSVSLTTLPLCATVGSLAGTVGQRPAHDGAAAFLASLAGKSGAAASADAAADADSAATAAAPTGAVVSRICRMVALPSVHPRLLLVGQEDGTVAFWHTLRRVCVGAVNLTSAPGVEDAEMGDDAAEWGGTAGGGAMTVVMDVEETEGRILVFGDRDGNVHVCRLRWRVLTESHEQSAALAMPNLALYCVTPTPPTPSREHFAAAAATAAGPGLSAAGGTGTEDALALERSLPVPQQLERVHVFASGLTLSSIRVVHAEAAASLVRAAAPPPPAPPPPNSTAAAGAESAATAAAEPGKLLRASSAARRSRRDIERLRLLIVCAGVDHYVRVFTLTGVPIGELGMDEWNASRPSTFRFMGEPTVPPAVPLPCSLAGNVRWQHDRLDAIKASDCYHDYLAELYAVHHARHPTRVGSIRTFARAGSASAAAAAAGSTRRTMGGTVHVSSLDCPPSRGTSRISPVARQPARAADAAVSLDRAPSTAAPAEQLSGGGGGGGGGGHANVVIFADGAGGTRGVAGRESPFLDDFSGPQHQRWQHPEAIDTPSHCLNARLVHNTRHRYEKDRRFRGVLKRSYARQLQRQYSEGSVSVSLSPSPVPAATPDAPQRPLAHAAADATTENSWSILLSAASVGNGAAAVAEELLVASLEQAIESPTSFVQESPHERRRGGAGGREAPRHSTASTMCLPADADSSTARRRPSTASTDAPHSAGGSPQMRGWKPCATVAVPPTLEMMPPLGTTATITAADGPVVQSSVLRGPSFTRRPPLPAVQPPSEHATATAEGRRGSRPPSSQAVSTSVPLIAVTARGAADCVPFSGYSFTAAAQFDAVGKAVPLSPPAPRAPAPFPHKRASVVDRQQAASLLAYLSTERARLTANTHTSAAREQLAALAVPVPTHPVSMGISRGSAVVAALSPRGVAAASSNSTAAVDIYDHVDSVLDKRRSRVVCRTPASQELASSAEGFLAQLTSRMYVSPVAEPPTPSTGRSRRHLSNGNSKLHTRRSM
ncbi:WD domain, G-beta repeat [Novymonas esmeraldas]|uniref:WD domain, G-beta repeat n=1 Tax=Novymonas esmeraldas TaxID=1808958 RepID=A0AAW0ENB2_9TRYP